MIAILSKKDCCGCAACIQKCPKQCISFEEDEEGFRYPLVNTADCINCDLCEKVCPMLHQDAPKTALQAFAATATNENLRAQSSSGGIFSLIAEQVLKEGGVVFGACYDENWEVRHSYIEQLSELSRLRGSKYLQSRIEDSFLQAESFLKAHRKVLFSGTACQIAGLRKFLRKHYDNLLLIDVICHGVPSPLIWRQYIKETLSQKPAHLTSAQISDINFRDKSSSGWKNYSITIRQSSKASTAENSLLVHETFRSNSYMKAFLNDLSLRPSCYNCPAKQGKSGSDITLGDFWGIHRTMPDIDDDKGVSLVLTHSKKGEQVFESLNSLRKWTVDIEKALSGNTAYYKSVQLTPKRTRFFKAYQEGRAISSITHKLTHRSLLTKCLHKIKWIIQNK